MDGESEFEEISRIGDIGRIIDGGIGVVFDRVARIEGA